MTFHRHPEGLGIDGKRNTREMVADEKSVVRREDALIENVEGRLELRRPAGLEDERALLWILDQRTFAIGKGQGDGIRPEGVAGIRADEGSGPGQSGVTKKLAAIERGGMAHMDQ